MQDHLDLFYKKMWHHRYELVNLLLHLLCGFGLALALPPLSWTGTGLAGLLVLVLLNRDLAALTKKQRFFRGLSFGLGYFGFALHWIGFAFLVDAESYLWMMPFAVGGLALGMAFFWGFGFVMSGWLARQQTPIWLALPFAMAIAEWLRGVVFTGFPWAAPGLIADGMGPVLQLASIVGMPGLTFLILLWGIAVGHLVDRRSTAAIFIVFSIPAAFAWGHWRLSAAPLVDDNGPIIRLVQPNISQSDKWRQENATAIFTELLALSHSPSAKVIVWPESAVPFLLDENADALAAIADVLQPGQVLLTGTLRRSFEADGRQKYFTSIHMIDDEGKLLESYDKWRLVPGGEYLPFAWALEPLGFRKVVDLPESFSAGPGPQSIAVPGVGLGGMLICYEAIFPHQLVDEKQRPRWLVNVTNDGWFGNSVGPYQHLAQVRMRAVEQGLPVARSANTGVSAMIDASGRVIASTQLQSRDVIEISLPTAIQPTIFSRYGNWMVFLLLTVCWASVRIFQPLSPRS